MKYRLPVIMVLSVVFIYFLYSFNRIEKVELISTKGRSFEKARVLELVKDNVQGDGSRAGAQIVKIEILSGSEKGRITEATAYEGFLHGAVCRKGMEVIAEINVYKDNITASIYNYHRSGVLYIIIGLFICCIWIIGGKKGLKSSIGLIFTFLCIIYLYLPMLYKGYSPFWSAVLIVIITTIVSIYLIGGSSYKTLSAILGTILGVVIAGIFADIFGHFSNISGNNVADIEELIFIGSATGIKVSGLLFSGLLISSLGAVMDVSMSISSTINEIYDQNKTLSRKSLFLSGMNVGRDMMGTMSNTLILAFTGGAINTLIIIYSYNMQYHQVINMYSIGIEIIRGISGSLGVIFTVPMVSAIAAYFIPKSKVRVEVSEPSYINL